MPRHFKREAPEPKEARVLLPFTQISTYVSEITDGGVLLKQQFSFGGLLRDVILFVENIEYPQKDAPRKVELSIRLELGGDMIEKVVPVKKGLNEMGEGFSFVKYNRVSVSLLTACRLKGVWFSAIAKYIPRRGYNLAQVEIIEDERVHLPTEERAIEGPSEGPARIEEHS